MLSVYALKPAFQNTLRPMVNRLAAWGVTANQITMAAFLLSVALGWELAYGGKRWLILPVFLFARMAMNAMDGMLAREHGQASRVGAVLNEVTDVVSDAALTWPLALLPGWEPMWVVFMIVLAAMVEGAGLAGVAMGGARRYEGPFGKSDRAVVLGAIGFWLGVGWELPGAAAYWIPRAFAALCFVTAMNRLRRAVV